jgi:CheY-like chemotaxis protein
MARDAGLNADQRENLAIINRSGEHLLSLINDALDMAKIEAGRTTLLEQDFDLHRLLADLVELFHARAAAKGLTLTLAQAPETPRLVHGDASKLRQVLINLLGNAIKFTAAGSVTLTVRVVSAGDAAAGQGCRLCFTVEDTGPGIAPEDSERIFEPFVQVVRGGAIQEGTGLGLPISREYARLMGGSLTVVSAGALGQGSSFRLEAPLGMAAAPTPAPPPAAARRSTGLAAGQANCRLLVADDRAESRKLLADLLTGLGFAVRMAENGAEAVALWQEWRPHLIWMDMRMPVMDGHEATRRIKATAEGQQTVIVAVSACVLSDEQTALHAAACDDFVRKPYRESEIVACLVKHLGVRMVYADAPTAQAAAPPAFDLTGLPAAWMQQVRRAAVAADAAHLLRLAAEVEREWPTVTSALCAAVEDFNYNIILTAIDQSRET